MYLYGQKVKYVEVKTTIKFQWLHKQGFHNNTYVCKVVINRYNLQNVKRYNVYFIIYGLCLWEIKQFGIKN